MCCGGGLPGWLPGLVFITPPAHPQPVILPAAPSASLGLAGALRRASPCGLALPCNGLGLAAWYAPNVRQASPRPDPSPQQAAARAKGEARRKAPPRRSAATAAAGRITGWGWAGGVIKTKPGPQRTHAPPSIRGSPPQATLGNHPSPRPTQDPRQPPAPAAKATRAVCADPTLRRRCRRRGCRFGRRWRTSIRRP